jgi:uncharacterized protein
MAAASREYQVFAKPIGARCNLDCHYCYYLNKEHLYQNDESFIMPDDVLEEYIVQHIAASASQVINFSWHGGEPTLLGLDYFRKIVAMQRKHQPRDRRITNGMQTNGTLIDEEWCLFLAKEGFSVGLSLDGPEEIHDRYRVTKGNKPTFRQAMHGYDLLRQHQISCDILCVVHNLNAPYPIQVYQFFKQVKAQYVGFLPLVERQPDTERGVSDRTVSAESWGTFLCTIFDEWLLHDIGHVKVQIFEEATRTAFGEEHSLCIFRKTCGDIPVIEHNGDFFSCDHYADSGHRLGNIRETSLVELLESPQQKAFGEVKFDSLPSACRRCEVLAMCNGACPKDRFLQTNDGQAGLNYLCAGYKHFFTHCRPFVNELAKLWQRPREGQTPQQVQGIRVGTHANIGRNAPCPCGSGKKYKRCCLGK